ncbi:MAG: hypothetical protein N2Z22_09995, partial [Turneriella sp.]|nr:hypothetical protein [Turneriella sp.]
GDFLRQLEKTDQKPLDFYRKLVSLCNEATAKENKNIDRDIKKKIRNIADFCAQILKSEEEGHHARSEYFSNIRADLKRPEFETIAQKCGITSDQLANLIGHVANLQLRL